MDMAECLAMLTRTLRATQAKGMDLDSIPLEMQEYWRENEGLLKKICLRKRPIVVQTFVKARRSPLRFAKWWPYGDVSKAMLDGKVLMLRVERKREKEWKERFEVVDVEEVREMLKEKRKKPAKEYMEICQGKAEEAAHGRDRTGIRNGG